MSIDCAGCHALFLIHEDGSTEFREPEEGTPDDSEEQPVSQAANECEESLDSDRPELQIPEMKLPHDWDSVAAPTSEVLELPEAEAPVASVMVNPSRLGVNVQWPKGGSLQESAAEPRVVAAPSGSAETPATPLEMVTSVALGDEDPGPEITAVYSLRELHQSPLAPLSDEVRVQGQEKVASDNMKPNGAERPITVPELPPWRTHPASFMNGAAVLRVGDLSDVVPEAVTVTVESGESWWAPGPEETRLDSNPSTEPSSVLAMAAASAIEVESASDVSSMSPDVRATDIPESAETRTPSGSLSVSVVEDEFRDAEFENVLKVKRSTGAWSAVALVAVLGGVFCFLILSGVNRDSDSGSGSTTGVNAPLGFDDGSTSASDPPGSSVTVGQSLEPEAQVAPDVEAGEKLNNGLKSASDGADAAEAAEERDSQRVVDPSPRARNRTRKSSVQRPASAKGEREPQKSSSVNRARAERLYRQSNLLIQQNKFEPAIDLLKDVITINPRHGAAYRSLGVSYMLLGRERKAIASYKRFVTLEPNHRDATRVRQIIREYEQR